MFKELTKKQSWRTFSVSPENLTGEAGMGGRSTDGAAAAAARDLGIGWKISPYVEVEAGETFTMADIKTSGAVKHIWLTSNMTSARDIILRLYWDGQINPAVEVPLGDFFASASNADYQPVNSLAVCVNPKNGYNCYWEMPFRKGFRMTFENRSEKKVVLYYQIDCEEKEIAEDVLYFHAQFHRVNPVPYGEVYPIASSIEGTGHYVGTYMYWGSNNNGWWGEGEIKFYIDDDTDFPTVCGTGTEDYFCGAFSFEVDGKYQPYSTPYAGLSKIDVSDETYRSQRRFNLYRWHITDPVYFRKKLRVTMQALGWRRGGRYLPLQDDISSVAFWYSDNLTDRYPALPDRDGLEII